MSRSILQLTAVLLRYVGFMFMSSPPQAPCSLTKPSSRQERFSEVLTSYSSGPESAWRDLQDSLASSIAVFWAPFKARRRDIPNRSGRGRKEAMPSALEETPTEMTGVGAVIRDSSRLFSWTSSFDGRVRDGWRQRSSLTVPER